MPYPRVLPRSEYAPGSFVFCHSKGIVARAIRLVQSWRSPSADSRWNHVAILHSKNLTGDWFVIQAEGHGVTKTRLLSDIAPGGMYEVVSCPATADPLKVVEFAEAQVGMRYGFLIIASILLNVLTPRKVSLRRTDTWICSALAAGSLWYGSWPKAMQFDDCYQITPAELYGWL